MKSKTSRDRRREAEHNTSGASIGGRNHYNIETCPKHGRTAHLSCLGGRCCKCQDESLVAQGLVKP